MTDIHYATGFCLGYFFPSCYVYGFLYLLDSLRLELCTLEMFGFFYYLMLIIDSKTFIHFDGIKTLINYDLSIKKINTKNCNLNAPGC